MKNIIEKSGMTLKEFSIKFEIPYNTVSQWYRGERNAPKWVKNLIEEKLSYKPLLDELYCEENIEYFCYSSIENQKTGVYMTKYKENVENWEKKAKNKIKVEKHFIKEIKKWEQ